MDKSKYYEVIIECLNCKQENTLVIDKGITINDYIYTTDIVE